MKITPRNVKFAWKHRRALWRYRNLIRHRHAIAGWAAAAGAAVAAGLIVTPAATALGCCVQTNCVAAPAVMLNAPLVAAVSVPLLTVSV